MFPLLNPELSFEDAKAAHIANTVPDGKEFFRRYPDYTGQIDRTFLTNFVKEFPFSPPFVPTTQVLHKLIAKAGMIHSQEDIEFKINPKMRRKEIDENDINEPYYEPYNSIAVQPKQIDYPAIKDPDFFERTSLMHLKEKFQKS